MTPLCDLLCCLSDEAPSGREGHLKICTTIWQGRSRRISAYDCGLDPFYDAQSRFDIESVWFQFHVLYLI